MSKIDELDKYWKESSYADLGKRFVAELTVEERKRIRKAQQVALEVIVDLLYRTLIADDEYVKLVNQCRMLKVDNSVVEQPKSVFRSGSYRIITRKETS